MIYAVLNIGMSERRSGFWEYASSYGVVAVLLGRVVGYMFSTSAARLIPKYQYLDGRRDDRSQFLVIETMVCQCRSTNPF